jgi:hypothetical protein
MTSASGSYDVLCPASKEEHVAFLFVASRRHPGQNAIEIRVTWAMDLMALLRK